MRTIQELLDKEFGTMNRHVVPPLQSVASAGHPAG
jgi:hypothetical protein